MAAEIAMKAFADFIRGRSIKLDDAKIDEAIVVLRRIVKEDVVAALDDAKEAFACRMDAIGVATFTANTRPNAIVCRSTNWTSIRIPKAARIQVRKKMKIPIGLLLTGRKTVDSIVITTPRTSRQTELRTTEDAMKSKAVVQKFVGQKWRIVNDQFGYEMFAAEVNVGTNDPKWSDMVEDAYAYDARDNRELKLAYWKADAKRWGLDPNAVKIVEVA